MKIRKSGDLPVYRRGIVHRPRVIGRKPVYNENIPSESHITNDRLFGRFILLYDTEDCALLLMLLNAIRKGVLFL